MADNFKVPFQYDGVHSCEAVVIACIDFRFWKETARYVEEHLGIKSYDFPKMPGAAKAINEAKEGEVPIQCICVPCDLHHVKKIVIINHSDCGAYGGSKAFDGDQQKEKEFHQQQLREAKERVLKAYPDKEVILAYAQLTDNNQSIEFIEVN